MISTKIQLKTDTIANWTLNEDALLLNGEAAVVQFPDGTSKLKIGDGTTVFKDLPYVDDNLQIQLSEDSGQTYSKLDELLLINIGADEYYELVKSGNVLSNAIYEVSSDNYNMMGERITNVAEPELSSDATSKNYVDTLIKQLQDTLQEIQTQNGTSIFKIWKNV